MSHPTQSHRFLSRTLAIIALLCSFALASGASAQSHHSSSSTHSSKPRASKKESTKDKRVHVRGYTRKDGTYVAPHDRSAPGTADSSSASTNAAAGVQPYRNGFIAEGYSPHSSVHLDKHGKVARSKSAKAAFQRQSPCPSTGKTNGGCRGYVVDHVNPLECGGADAPSNMQWQTTAEAKAKDKTERSCRQ